MPSRHASLPLLIQNKTAARGVRKVRADGKPKDNTPSETELANGLREEVHRLREELARHKAKELAGEREGTATADVTGPMPAPEAQAMAAARQPSSPRRLAGASCRAIAPSPMTIL
jgi:hypothetical protein